MVHLVTFSLLTWDLMEVGRKRKDVDTPLNWKRTFSLQDLKRNVTRDGTKKQKQLEDIRWIPNINEHYYYVDSRMYIGKIYNVQSVFRQRNDRKRKLL